MKVFSISNQSYNSAKKSEAPSFQGNLRPVFDRILRRRQTASANAAGVSVRLGSELNDSFSQKKLMGIFEDAISALLAAAKKAIKNKKSDSAVNKAISFTVEINTILDTARIHLTRETYTDKLEQFDKTTQHVASRALKLYKEKHPKAFA